jgi:hypothetical protein
MRTIDEQGRFVKTDPIIRFWSKVKKTDTCWLWEGYLDKGGYGSFKFEEKTVRAHRYSYLIHFGNLDKNLVVMHICDNPSCVRPEHLILSTQKENINDKVFKDRQAKGSTVGTSKLSESEVKEIKSLISTLSYAKIAKIYNVDRSLIYLIAKGKSWKHV